MRDVSKRTTKRNNRRRPASISGEALSDPSWAGVLKWLAEDPTVLAYLDVVDTKSHFTINRRTIDLERALDRLRRSIA
jgi:hypothetical protein